jgi:hypothetical protein
VPVIGHVAMDRLGLSRASAFAAVARGNLPSIRIGKHLIIPRRAIERMLSGRATMPRPRQSHIWEREANDWCQEPVRCRRMLKGHGRGCRLVKLALEREECRN